MYLHAFMCGNDRYCVVCKLLILTRTFFTVPDYSVKELGENRLIVVPLIIKSSVIWLFELICWCGISDLSHISLFFGF